MQLHNEVITCLTPTMPPPTKPKPHPRFLDISDTAPPQQQQKKKEKEENGAQTGEEVEVQVSNTSSKLVSEWMEAMRSARSEDYGGDAEEQEPDERRPSRQQ